MSRRGVSRDRNQTSGCQGLGEGENEESLLNVYRGSFWSGANVLELV